MVTRGGFRRADGTGPDGRGRCHATPGPRWWHQPPGGSHPRTGVGAQRAQAEPGP